MSETEINTQHQRRKISKLANASLICMIAEYGLLTLAILCGKLVAGLFIILMPILLVATPMLGILSLIQIRKSKGHLCGKLRVVIAIIMTLIMTVFMMCFYIVSTDRIFSGN